MSKVTTVVIGAGHCGLAMSRRLAERGIDHVILERGETAHSWATERWASLRLLTPNWMTRLPGDFAYQGEDPDGYLSAPQVVSLLQEYAAHIAAPVHTRTTVTGVRPDDGGFVVQTDQGSWQARTVVLASGACNLPALPPVAEAVPSGITSLTPLDYRSPDDLPEGGVLVVGASSSGIQIAEEVHRSGRPVTVAVGEHVRLPRCYRGRDILWWMDAAGLFDERYDEVPDLLRARTLPSMQLVGSPQRTLDLNSLTDLGVRLVGRIGAIRDGVAMFSGSLPNVCALADLKLGRLLDTFDAWAEETGFTPDEPPHRYPPTRVPSPPTLSLDLGSGEIRTIIWATGFRPDWSWLDVPVLDRKGRVKHDGGVVNWPGLYVVGMPFLRRRKSSLIDGAAADTHDLSEHLATYLDTVASTVS